MRTLVHPLMTTCTHSGLAGVTLLPCDHPRLGRFECPVLDLRHPRCCLSLIAVIWVIQRPAGNHIAENPGGPCALAVAGSLNREAHNLETDSEAAIETAPTLSESRQPRQDCPLIFSRLETERKFGPCLKPKPFKKSDWRVFIDIPRPTEYFRVLIFIDRS